MGKPKKIPREKAPKPTLQPTPREPEATDFIEIGGSPVPGLTLRHVLRGHTKGINRIAWSPDGTYLASPSNDKSICIWDISTSECVHVLKGHEDTIISLSWSPDGQSIVSGGFDKCIRFWNLHSIKPYRLLESFSENIRSVSHSINGEEIAVGGTAGYIQIFNLRTDTIKTIHQGGNVNSVAW